MRSSFVLIVVALASFAAARCSSTPSAPSQYAAFSKTDLLVGVGDEARTGTSVTVKYTGWLYDASATDHKGLQFDSTVGRSPFTFTLGAGHVIKGWDEGVVGMRAGGIRRLVVPPSLAYGANRNAIIPPYATLVFDIELVSVTAASGS